MTCLHYDCKRQNLRCFIYLFNLFSSEAQVVKIVSVQILLLTYFFSFGLVEFSPWWNILQVQVHKGKQFKSHERCLMIHYHCENIITHLLHLIITPPVQKDFVTVHDHMISYSDCCEQAFTIYKKTVFICHYTCIHVQYNDIL